MLAGLLIGGGSALVSDRRTGLVFSGDELSHELPGPGSSGCLLGDEREAESWRAPIQLLADGPLAGDGSVALIPVGSVEAADLEVFSTSLRQALGPQRKLLISRDLLATRACGIQLLLTAPGAAKREQLRQLREHLTLQGTPVAGWVLLDTSLEA